MANRKTTAPPPKFIAVDALRHADDKRRNIPTAEYQSLMADEARKPVQVSYPRGTSNTDGLQAEKQQRNTDLDPQLVWRGKDEQDWTDLVVNAPPLYIQEKVHPKVLIDDLLRQSRERREAAEAAAGATVDMFADFNGIPAGADKTDFYAHDQNWSNRMILGNSQMASHPVDQPRRAGLRVTSISRGPDQVKAFWPVARRGQFYLTSAAARPRADLAPRLVVPLQIEAPVQPYRRGRPLRQVDCLADVAGLGGLRNEERRRTPSPRVHDRKLVADPTHDAGHRPHGAERAVLLASSRCGLPNLGAWTARAGHGLPGKGREETTPVRPNEIERQAARAPPGSVDGDATTACSPARRARPTRRAT
ncbi:MAG: hypothetical protein IPQ21_02675 [Betaproteobacteria bacterium]|nr:hypothetical protein [Betaproteobacteria bacterium]